MEKNQLLIKIGPRSQNLKNRSSTLTTIADLELEPLDKGTESPSSNFKRGNFASESLWYAGKSKEEINTWEQAHEFYEANKEKGIEYVEPDLDNKIYETTKAGDSKSDKYNPDWAIPGDDEFAWYLDDDRTQLRKANNHILTDHQESSIRIAHLDTGYDPGHKSLPKFLNLDLQRNFIEGEDLNSAVDPYHDAFLRHPGHGTGTLAILAGNIRESESDYTGAAPFSEIIPIRIAKTVALFKTSAVAKAIKYAININCDVISMSMGGYPSKLWAERVDEAYEAGIVMVSAGGNNFGGFPVKGLVYPARYERVIAACGITYDNTPYYKPHNLFGGMQGNCGPEEHMKYALAAYTPNVPWAEFGSETKFRKTGAGTSSATPQIAGAAALVLEKLGQTTFSSPWQRAETVRTILFETADPKGNHRKHVGKGAIQTFNALHKRIEGQVQQAPNARFFGAFDFFFNKSFKTAPPEKKEMLRMELLQLSLHSETVYDSPSEMKSGNFINQEMPLKDEILDSSQASEVLKAYIR